MSLFDDLFKGGGPEEGSSDKRQMARELHDWMVAFKQEGFTEAEAFKLTTAYMTTMIRAVVETNRDGDEEL